jgi:hypothetical protein
VRNNDTDTDRGEKPLRFSAQIDCEVCDAEFEGQWAVDAIDLEQLVDPPQEDQRCPEGHIFRAEYPGWLNYSDA